MRLALDQNFHIPLINAIRDYLPPTVQLAHLKSIDRRMPELADRPLIIALHQTGWDGLITNNYKMLDVPGEVAAIVKTKLTVGAVEGHGQDPTRAVGALLLELPGIPRRIHPRRANVFRLAYRQHPPTPGTTSRPPPGTIEIPTTVARDRSHRPRTRNAILH